MHCVVEIGRPKRVATMMVIVLPSSQLNPRVGEIRVILLPIVFREC
jgi:hypothetical protein